MVAMMMKISPSLPSPKSSQPIQSIDGITRPLLTLSLLPTTSYATAKPLVKPNSRLATTRSTASWLASYIDSRCQILVGSLVSNKQFTYQYQTRRDRMRNKRATPKNYPEWWPEGVNLDDRDKQTSTIVSLWGLVQFNVH